MYPRLVICGFIFTALISATPSPSPVTTPSSRRLCVYDNRFGLNYDPCAPFTSVHVTVLATFSTTVFGAWFEYDRRPVVDSARSFPSARQEAGSRRSPERDAPRPVRPPTESGRAEHSDCIPNRSEP